LQRLPKNQRKSLSGIISRRSQRLFGALLDSFCDLTILLKICRGIYTGSIAGRKCHHGALVWSGGSGEDIAAACCREKATEEVPLVPTRA
jgi:hypothetical protein